MFADLHIAELAPERYEDWDRFVASPEAAGIYHTAAWHRVNVLVQTLKSATRSMKAHEIKREFDWTS